MGRRALVLLVALLLAGVAAFAVFQFLNGIRADVEAERAKQPVFRATQFIPEGSAGSLVLQSGQIAASEENVEDTPTGAIGTEAELQAILTGRLAVGPVETNEIIVQSQWAELTVDLIPLSELIPSGKQALTISTDAVRGVNGFIEPGDLINMIITLDIEFSQIPADSPIFGIPVETTAADGTGAPADEDGATVTYTRFVMQGVPVLAVARDIRPQGDEETTVTTAPIEGGEEGTEPATSTVFTLEVTPEQAERIVFAFENGSIWLTLVPEDFVEVETQGVTIESLFTGDLVDDIFGN